MKNKKTSTKLLSAAKINRIFTLHAKGKLSERAIAKKIGCSRSNVWYHLNKREVAKKNWKRS